MCGKSIYGVHTPRNILILDIFTYASSHSKLVLKFLPSRCRQKEITHSLQTAFLSPNLCPPTTKRGGENYDLL